MKVREVLRQKGSHRQRFFVKIYRHGKDYSAMVPDLPGCVAASGTVEKVRKLITKAIKLHLELLQESGEVLPKSRTHIDVQAESDGDEAFYTWVEIELDNPVAA